MLGKPPYVAADVAEKPYQKHLISCHIRWFLRGTLEGGTSSPKYLSSSKILLRHRTVENTSYTLD